MYYCFSLRFVIILTIITLSIKISTIVAPNAISSLFNCWNSRLFTIKIVNPMVSYTQVVVVVVVVGFFFFFNYLKNFTFNSMMDQLCFSFIFKCFTLLTFSSHNNMVIEWYNSKIQFHNFLSLDQNIVLHSCAKQPQI